MGVTTVGRRRVFFFFFLNSSGVFPGFSRTIGSSIASSVALMQKSVFKDTKKTLWGCKIEVVETVSLQALSEIKI